ncbi:NUDIX hydrolase [Natronosalvus halobius]|uniref:NUDIX hydrolase n=1 Tax=Natronosalvus halobius TaxID=2953746 RepID=UPI00209E98A7|nr:hypothetical protein [Natronosalvus halobius]USZ71133.1 hypothetical protein NGM15_13720 [Natronosalvus halobius]
MGNQPPTFCHYCGGELTPVDTPTVHCCDACEEYVFYNPSPCSRIAVVDGESILLGKVDLQDRDLWGTPGGMVDAGEDPDEAGARDEPPSNGSPGIIPGANTGSTRRRGIGGRFGRKIDSNGPLEIERDQDREVRAETKPAQIAL